MSKSPDFKALYELYKSEADVYYMHYEDQIIYSKTFLTFAGVLCRMESDLLEHEQKRGTSDKLKEAFEKIKILHQVYQSLSGLDEQNKRSRILLHENKRQIAELEKENENLKKQLEGVEKAWKQE